MSREAMTLALEALEAGDWYIGQLEAIVYSADDNGLHAERAKVQSAISALRAALDKPEPEPVAWMCANEELVWKGYSRFSQSKGGDWNIPVYTYPPQRKPLTDEDVTWVLQHGDSAERDENDRWHVLPYSFARAIEAKLKERNT